MRKTPRSQRREQQRDQGHGRRHRALGAAVLGPAVAAAGLAVTAGCSVAPPGTAGTSPAIGPVRTGAATANFGPFPIPATWNGRDYRFYRNLVKGRVGAKPSNLRFVAHADLVFWLSCIGTGTAQLDSPGLRFRWSVRCGSGADPAAVNFSPRAAAVGHAVNVMVTASPGARWETRVDIAAPPGSTPAPAVVPAAKEPAGAGRGPAVNALAARASVLVLSEAFSLPADDFENALVAGSLRDSSKYLVEGLSNY